VAEIPLPAIQTRGLTRDFGAGRGVFDLNLEVQPGEAYGYLGPNGAGKSTTLRLLMGLLRPTYGSARIFGVDVSRDPVRVKGMVGYLPGELAQFGDMRGGQVLSLLAGLRGGVSTAYIKALSQRLGLDLSGRYRAYSRGNKQKLAVVAALMARPRLLILDEPTSGLDPIVQQEFYKLIVEAREAGTTVFMSSHLFAEVEHTCTRIGIIRAGRLVRDGGLEEIHSMRVHRVTISFEGELDGDRLNDVEGVSQVTIRDSLLTCQVRGEFDPLLRAISGVRVTNLVSAEPSLEEVFLSYYADEATPAPAPAAEPQPPVPFEAEAEPLPAGETVYFGRDDAPASRFELRDWLAAELDTESEEPREDGDTSDPESGLEQLAWTDPGPGANPATEPETGEAPEEQGSGEQGSGEQEPWPPGPSLFDHDPEPDPGWSSSGEEPSADR
jgi:ABC-2 type transport system ATP-binding protein